MSTPQPESTEGGSSTPGPLVLVGPDALRAAAGRELGPTRPVVIGADRVDAFESATRQPSPGALLPPGACGAPGGVAVAEAGARAVPGLLLLSLVNYVLPRLVDVRGFDLGVNYGTGEVRFPAPLAVGCSVRGSLLVLEVADVPGGLQAIYRVTLARASTGDPTCVADSIARYLV
jgi:acyl dehydratase